MIKTHRILCILNDDDKFSIDNADYKANLSEKSTYHYTFWDKNKQKLNQLPKFFSNESLDLLYLSLMIYYSDRLVLRSTSPDSWTRRFKIFMPVLEVDKWNHNKNILISALNYLSGDIWDFEFRKRNLNNKEIKRKEIITKNKSIDISKICMLSGGLDSFIGAIDLLEQEKKLLFVGHYGGGKGVKQFQDLLTDTLISKYKLNQNQFYKFHAAPVNGKEDTTRSRSFMFFSHAIALASTFKNQVKLIIPENGLISLNIPLTCSRYGSSSTRTTHPYYMSLFQQIIDNLDINVKLYNPYQFKTKGEMIKECLNQDILVENINNTMSCSHPDQARYDKIATPCHCGNCFPCIIRRAAIGFAMNIDSTQYWNKDFELGKKSKEYLNSYFYAINRYKAFEKTNCLNIQKNGRIDNNIEEFAGVYQRGMMELEKLISKYYDI